LDLIRAPVNGFSLPPPTLRGFSWLPLIWAATAVPDTAAISATTATTSAGVIRRRGFSDLMGTPLFDCESEPWGLTTQGVAPGRRSTGWNRPQDLCFGFM